METVHRARSRSRATIGQQDWHSAPVVSVPLGGEPLDLEQTLRCGQAFRWSRAADVGATGADAWEGVVGGHVWRIARVADALNVQSIPWLPEPDVVRAVRHYFALDRSAREIQRCVAAAHPLAAEAVERLSGLRVLRQDPVETFFTFAIASATNVPRVTRSVERLCRSYGRTIAEVEGTPHHAFPTADAILKASYADLFGPCNLAFRARHLQSYAEALVRNNSRFGLTGEAGRAVCWSGSVRSPWLESLASGDYRTAHAALDALPYCGPKVADCICLFGLGFGEAVPVDVHVWAIAHDLFGAKIPTRSLTAATYQRVADLYRELFGQFAGWAQQYLYAARRATPLRERSRPSRV